MRKKVISKEMIQNAAISCVADIGLENFTTKKTADIMGISEGSIFNNYANKGALLTDCLYLIDHEIDAVLKDVPFHITSFTNYIHDLWYAYFNYLITHGDKAKFYFQFRHSSYYTKSVITGQSQSFGFFSKFLNAYMHVFHVESDIFWVYVIETTINFAIRFVNHDLEPTEENIQSVYNLITKGISGIYHPDKTFDTTK